MMRMLTHLILGGALLLSAPAWAQVDQPAGAPPHDHPKVTVVFGTIAALDLRPGGGLLLNDGTRLSMPPDSEQLVWTDVPEVGEQVRVTYDIENGQRVVREIEPEQPSADGGQ